MVGKVLTRASFDRTIDYNINKLSQTNDTVGALEYNLNKSELFHTNLIGDKETFAKQMLLVANQNDRIKNPVKHFVISFAPDDEKKVTKDLCKEIVDDYLKGMGYENNQFCAFIHKDTDNLHIHIVCNRVKFDGKVVSDSNEKYKSRAILTEMEKKYGFVQTKEAKRSNYQSYKVSKNQFENKNLIEDEKIKYMREQVRFALKKHPITLESLKKLLSEKHIEVEITKNGKGLEYMLGDFKIHGSQLNKLYSFNNINAQLRKHAIYQFNKALKDALKTNPESIDKLFEELKDKGFQAQLNNVKNGWTIEKDGVKFKGSELNRMSFIKLKEKIANNYKEKEIRDIIWGEMNKNKTFQDFLISLSNQNIDIKTISGENKVVYKSAGMEIKTGRICDLNFIDNQFKEKEIVTQRDSKINPTTGKISIPKFRNMGESRDDEEEERKRKRNRGYEQEY